MTSAVTVSPLALADQERRLEDRARLHLVDLGVDDAEPAAAQAQHRVRLLQLGEAAAHGLELDVGGLRDRLPMSFCSCGRNSCSGGSSSRTGHRQAAHDLEQLGEVVALHRQDLGERPPPPLAVLGQDHMSSSRHSAAGTLHDEERHAMSDAPNEQEKQRDEIRKNLTQTLIAQPLLDYVLNESLANKAFDVIINPNLDYEGGRPGAIKRIEMLIDRVRRDGEPDPKVHSDAALHPYVFVRLLPEQSWTWRVWIPPIQIKAMKRPPDQANSGWPE